MLPEDSLTTQRGTGTSGRLTREARIGEISRRLLVECYAPAAVVVDRKHEILFSMGPVDQYLSLQIGQPNRYLLALTAPDLRAKLRTALQNVLRTKQPESIAGGQVMQDGNVLAYRTDVLPLQDQEPLQLVCFVAEPAPPLALRNGDSQPPEPWVTPLEQELEAVKAELRSAIRDFKITNEEHRAINEEAMVANEESQVTIEELMAWKMGLESLAQEMTELNGQLQQTLEAQRDTSNILGNILNNIGAAVLLLDRDLKIRFFTPAIRPFFHLITGDAGRPLSDLKYLALDELLAADCQAVLQNQQVLERKVVLAGDQWFLRRILPYRLDNGEVDGLIISFSHVTETGSALVRKSAITVGQAGQIASGTEPRQVMQRLSRLQGPGNANLSGEAGHELIRLIGQASSVLANTLNSLRDKSQSEPAGETETSDFPSAKTTGQRDEPALKVASLTPRERQIMKMVVSGQPSKIIATDLGISQRTVENHRSAIMRKTESKSLPALARVAFASGLSDIRETPAAHKKD